MLIHIRKIFHILTSVLLLLVVPDTILAQPEIKREHYSREDGLPSNAISDILYDSRGYVWFSTWEGLSRFDGFDFVNYKAGVDSHIPYFHNRIARIYEDKTGNIWLMMYDEKLFRLNRKTDKFESLIDSFPNSINARVKGPLFSSNGDVWAIVRDSGVLEIMTDSLTNEISVRFHALDHMDINQLYEDSFSTIWVATSNGISVLKSNILPLKQFEEKEEDKKEGKEKDRDKVRGIEIEKEKGNEEGDKEKEKGKEKKEGKEQALVTAQLDSCIYWGTSDGNLITFDYATNLMTHHTIKPNEPILSLTAAPKESALYTGTKQSGLYRYDVRYAKTKQIIPGPLTVNSLYTDSEGLIWMFTNHPGVTMYHPQSDKYTSFRQKVSTPEEYNPAGTIDEVSGVVWVRMNRGGFGYYDRQANAIDYFHNHPDVPDDLSNVVSAVEISSPDVVWVTTSRRGADKLSIINKKVERLQLEKEASSLLANDIRALYLDNDSILWVAAKSGIIYCLDKEMNIIRRITEADSGSPFGRIYVITQDGEGDYWLGTKGNGLFRLSKDGKGKFQFERFVHHPDDPYSISANDIYSILIDSKNRMWIGTYGGGVNLIEKNQQGVHFLSARNSFKNYPIASCNRVRALVEDEEGRIWAGTTEGLVSLAYDEGKKDVRSVIHRKEVNSPHSLSSNDMMCAFRDSNRNLWFGTIGGGLNRYTGMTSSGKAEFVSYTVQDGLPSNEVRSITEDQDGNLWLATENNICSFHLSTGIISKLSLLEGVDHTIISESAATVTANGHIVFGTVDGYYLIDKHKLSGVVDGGFKLQIVDFQMNEEPTSPRLNTAFEKYVPESRSVTLPDRHAVFSIKFASLNFPLQHRVHYQYMLEGYDEGWHNADRDRKATYANVPAGEYVFNVRAFLPEDPACYELKSLHITVPSSFWASSTAYVMYFFVLILLGAGMWWFMYRRKTMLKKLRVLKVGPSEIAFRDDDDYEFISGLLEWLEKNYTHPDLKIEDMVSHSGLGRTTFYNRLKTLVEMSPIEFISDFRMKKARMYIEKTNRTIAEIAYQTGFSDPVYFTRLFKSKYNETPTQCRKRASHTVVPEEDTEKQ